MIPLQAPKPSDSSSLRRLRWADRKRRASQGPTRTQRAERDFARTLRDIGKHVGELIAGFEPGEISAVPTLQTLLERYAEALTPWAERTVARMLQPSTRHFTASICLSFGNRFILTIMRERSCNVKCPMEYFLEYSLLKVQVNSRIVHESRHSECVTCLE